MAQSCSKGEGSEKDILSSDVENIVTCGIVQKLNTDEIMYRT